MATITNITKDKEIKAFDEFKAKYGYTNVMQRPRLLKVVVSVGTGKMSRADKKKNEMIADRVSKITGQKTLFAPAKKAIATYKTREGDIIGLSVTLRGNQMYAFLEKFLNIALPRAKDFRGISPRTVDTMGNCSIGIKEHTIFPESSEEDLRDVFGMGVTIVTNRTNKDEARDFLKFIGVPFRAADEPKKERAKKKKKEKKVLTA